MNHYNTKGNLINVTVQRVFFNLIKFTQQISLFELVQIVPNKATDLTVKKISIQLLQYRETAENTCTSIILVSPKTELDHYNSQRLIENYVCLEFIALTSMALLYGSNTMRQQ